MEERPLLSIIVPVYNSEEYLGKAFDSVLKQSFKDLELILINDGSTDRSEDICQAYMKKDRRVKLFTKRNGGICSARNVGISHANGRYLMFMDNDDEYIDGAFDIISNAIYTFGTDIIRFNRRRIQIFDNFSQKVDIYGTRGITNGIPVKYNKNQFFDNYEKVRNSGCFSGIWNGAFKRELFYNIRFDESITFGGEDTIVNFELYSIFNTVTFLPDVLYVYYRRANHSVSTQFQMNQIAAISKIAALERKILIDNHVNSAKYLSYSHVYLAEVIKQLNHKNSTLKSKDKHRVLDELCESSDGFQYTMKDIRASNISMFKKLYLGLYVCRKYRFLMTITTIILKFRGNI